MHLSPNLKDMPTENVDVKRATAQNILDDLQEELQKNLWSIGKILEEEGSTIQQLTGAYSKKRYIFDPNTSQWLNNMTLRGQGSIEFDCPVPTVAQADMPAAKAFYIFTQIRTEKAHGVAATADTIESLPEGTWYTNKDGTISAFETVSQRVPEDHILFITLGKVNGGGQESVLFLRKKGSFNLAEDAGLLAAIGQARTIALKAYKKRVESSLQLQGAGKLDIPAIAIGNAWLDYQERTRIHTQIPDDIEKQLNASFDKAIEEQFLDIFQLNLEKYLEHFKKINKKDYLHGAALADDYRDAIFKKRDITPFSNMLQEVLYSFDLDSELFKIFLAYQMDVNIALLTIIELLNYKDQNPDKSIITCLDELNQKYQLTPLEGMRTVQLETLRNIEDAMHEQEFRNIPEGRIVVGESYSSSQGHRLAQKHKVRGIVSIQNEANDHIAIMARSVNLPIVTGLKDKNVWNFIDPNDPLILDGVNNVLIIKPSAEQIRTYELMAKALQHKIREFEPIRDKKMFLRDRNGKLHEVFIKENVEYNFDSTEQFTADVGLVRTENYVADNDKALTREQAKKIFLGLLTKFKSVIARTLDFGRDKPPPEDFPSMYKDLATGEQIPSIEYSQLPYVRRANLNILAGLFDAMQATQNYKVEVMIPMLEDARHYLIAGKELVLEAKRLANYAKPVNIRPMIETYASYRNYEDFLALEEQGLSFGSNDYIHEMIKKMLRALLENAGTTSELIQNISNDTKQTLLDILLNIPEFKDQNLSLEEIKKLDIDVVLNKLNGHRGDPKLALLKEIIPTIETMITKANAFEINFCICGNIASDFVILALLYSFGYFDVSIGNHDIPYLKPRILKLSEHPEVLEQIYNNYRDLFRRELTDAQFKDALYEQTAEILRKAGII